MIITADWLKSKKACVEVTNWIAQNYPNGVEVTEPLLRDWIDKRLYDEAAWPDVFFLAYMKDPQILYWLIEQAWMAELGKKPTTQNADLLLKKLERQLDIFKTQDSLYSLLLRANRVVENPYNINVLLDQCAVIAARLISWHTGYTPATLVAAQALIVEESIKRILQ